MKKIAAVLIAAPLLWAGASFANDDGHGDKDKAEWHKEMCTDRYAHTFGRLAYMEAKLNLTDKQQDSWNKWQQIELDSAAKERDDCLQNVPGEKPSILEKESFLEKMLTAKLDELKASRPALETLYNSLSGDQKEQFDRISDWERGHHAMHGDGGPHGPMPPAEEQH
jgi:hypothetical protein